MKILVDREEIEEAFEAACRIENIYNLKPKDACNLHDLTSALCRILKANPNKDLPYIAPETIQGLIRDEFDNRTIIMQIVEMLHEYASHVIHADPSELDRDWRLRRSLITLKSKLWGGAPLEGPKYDWGEPENRAVIESILSMLEEFGAGEIDAFTMGARAAQKLLEMGVK